MYTVTVWYNDNTFDSFESVTSVEIAIGPSHRPLTETDIKNLENIGSKKDIYVFNSDRHLIRGGSFKRLTIKEES